MSYFSNQTIEQIPDYIVNQTVDSIYFSEPTSFDEDVIDENKLDDWSIDDFLCAIPKTIMYGINNIIYNLSILYTDDNKCIIRYYNSNINQSILEVTNINTYDAFKEFYSKLKLIDKV